MIFFPAASPFFKLAPICSCSLTLVLVPNGKLASQNIVTANAQLSSDIYGAVYPLSSTVFTVLFKGGSRSLQCEYHLKRTATLIPTPRMSLKI